MLFAGAEGTETHALNQYKAERDYDIWALCARLLALQSIGMLCERLSNGTFHEGCGVLEPPNLGRESQRDLGAYCPPPRTTRASLASPLLWARREAFHSFKPREPTEPPPLFPRTFRQSCVR